MSQQVIKSSGVTPQAIRRIVLEQSKRAKVGHIGSALGVADIVAALYAAEGGAMRLGGGPDDAERDRFVMSKGHAALSLYAALYLRGWLDADGLNSFCGDGTRAGVHPESVLHGIDFCTGSLGQGLSMGTGAALGARLQGSARRVFVLMSDAECNEGSVWEAATFAAHHKLGNLRAVIDLNGQQAFGMTRDVLNMENMAERWRAWRWDVHEVDGHDADTMAKLLGEERPAVAPPRMVIANTVFGRGVSYMERQIKWHYWPMNDEEYCVALGECGPVSAAAEKAADGEEDALR